MVADRETENLRTIRLVRSELDKLLEYSRSLPTGQMIGKWWRQIESGRTLVGTFVPSERKGSIGLAWYRVKIVSEGGYAMKVVYDQEALDKARTEVVRLAQRLAKECERGDRLNKRNGRMETELSLLKPESAAKKAMDEAYSEMQAKVAALTRDNEALTETVAKLGAMVSMACEDPRDACGCAGCTTAASVEGDWRALLTPTPGGTDGD